MRRRSLNQHAFLVTAVGVLAGATTSVATGEPSHPVISAFDRFYEQADPPPAIAGELLIGELNCVACHRATEPVRKRLRVRTSPRLDRVGNRLSREAMARFIRRPHAAKPGTTMPTLFREGESAERVERIAGYVAALGDSETPADSAPTPSAERGRRRYHRLGCVACHAPEPGYRPADVPASVDLEPPAGSVPIALAGHYDRASLVEFLLDPLALRPSGRMPDLQVTERAAVDLAAYLRQRFAVSDGEDQPAMNPRRGGEKGRRAFAAVGCANCHETGDGTEPRLDAPPLDALPAAAKGCLAKPPRRGLPDFRLSGAQRSAIVTAMEKLGRTEATAPAEAVRRIFLALDCYACHERNGRGGPTARRRPYFRSTTAKAEALGREARIPPPLTDAGAKLTTEWLDKVLTGAGDVRPYLATRMPVFGKQNVAGLVDALVAADAEANAGVEIDVSGVAAHHRGFIGRRLVGTDGLNCISCHPLRGHDSLGPPAVDLALATERLRPAYFKRLLLNPQEVNPGTTMPPMFDGGKSPVQAMIAGRDPAKQIEQLWIYLREADQMPLPKGMATEHFVVDPEGRPVVTRCFLDGVGMQAIAVGYPENAHVAFDAKQVVWAMRWRGAFLDMRGKWQDRFQPPLTPLGEEVEKWPDDPPFAVLPDAKEPWPDETGRPGGFRFKGYRLDEKGVPTMLYRYKDLRIEDTLKPAPNGDGLLRRVKVRGDADDLWFRTLDGKRRRVRLDDGKATIRSILP